MKIVFWSPVHGQARQSSNLLAVSLKLVMEQHKKIMVTQTQYRMNDLEDAVVGRAGKKAFRERFYQDMGMDSLIRCLKRKQIEKADIENCCIQLLPDEDFILLPGSQCENYEIFQETVGETVHTVLEEAEQYYDYVFVDTNPGGDRISRKLLQTADLIVVNLSQNVGVIDRFFWDYPEELRGKRVFFLFGSYLPDSCYNLSNLRYRYRLIRRNNAAVIPMNVGFMDAIAGGNVRDYFAKNLECEPGDVNYTFMKEVGETVRKMTAYIAKKIPASVYKEGETDESCIN